MADYYKTCAIPKPSDKKKKPLNNGYKGKKNRRCRYCGTPYAERHEVFGGTGNRMVSILYEFQVDLCRECHEEIQQRSTERGRKRDMELRREFQQDYEQKLINAGFNKESARAAWINLIGRSYLEE